MTKKKNITPSTIKNKKSSIPPVIVFNIFVKNPKAVEKAEPIVFVKNLLNPFNATLIKPVRGLTIALKIFFIIITI